MKRIARAKPLLRRSWRYGLVGAFCALSNYIILVAVDAAGGHYLLGTVIAFCTVTPAAYLLHSRFTFAHAYNFKAFARFVAGVASSYPVAVGSMVILCSGLHLTVPIATPLATIGVLGWNFVAAHWSLAPRDRAPRQAALSDEPATS
jgi:putative flippase GtrA